MSSYFYVEQINAKIAKITTSRYKHDWYTLDTIKTSITVKFFN